MKITDKKELVKIISFLAMTDGSIHKNGGSKNFVFSISATEEHEDFILWVKSVLENVTSCNVHLQQREHPRKNIFKAQTLTHPFFEPIHDRIYVGGYKSIDNHALKQLDWHSLALMYMCDGCLGVCGKAITTTLNLCRLSYGDQLLLKKALKEQLDLEWNVVRTGGKYYTLRLRMKDFDKFMYGISPYIFESFKYKLLLRTTNPNE